MNFRAILERLKVLFHGDKFRAELEEEMRLHHDLKMRELRTAGVADAELNYATRRAFGNATVFSEQSREHWGWNWFGDLARDCRFAVRGLRSNPGFTLVAVLTLVLGIGASTAIFSVVNTVLLRPLNFENPATLVRLEEKHEGFEHVAFSYATYIDLSLARSRSLASVAGYRPWSYNLTDDGDPEQVDGAMVSANIFAVLGAAPELGRAFTSAEQREGADHVVMISYALWKQRFAGDPGIIGRVIRVNDTPHQVLGVMPRSFEFPDRTVWLAGSGTAQLWTPLVTQGYLAANRKSHLIKVIGRLADGMSLAAAESELDGLAQHIARQYPGVDPGMGIGLWNLQQRMTSEVRPALLVLLGAVGLMVLAACANVANLVLMRNSARAREFAVRAALGAGQARLLRQSLVESALLGLVGGAGGVLVAFWSVKLIAALGPQDVPRLSQVRVDGYVLGFALVVSSLSAITFGAFPAASACATDPNESLKEGAKGTTSVRVGRLRAMLVVAEIAVAVVLLAGGAVLANSFVRISRVSPGFDRDHLLTMSLFLSPSRYANRQNDIAPFLSEVVSRVRALPGVTSAGVVNNLPILGGVGTDFHIVGRPDDGQYPEADVRIADENYLSTMRIPLLRGRWFNIFDTESSPKVMVINSSMAQSFWPGQDPIGKQVTMLNWGPPLTGEIVGVIGDVKDALEAPAGNWFYWPERQFPSIFAALVVRTAGRPLDYASGVKAAVWSVDPQQSVAAVQTMDQVISESTARRRMQAVLINIFSALALLIALVGTYGVVAYSVSRRSREIGIRMALGADRQNVRNLLLREGLRWVLVGAALGIAGALALGGALKGLLYGITAHDPLTLAGVTLLVSAVALLACYVPARRAMNLEPNKILREQ
jgi:predicted permease